MKFWLSLVTVREIEQLPTLARLAEQLGFHGLMIGDHLVMPAKIESRYPYSPDGKLFLPLDTPWPDPWITFAHLAAHTQKLEFASNIYLAALRDPFSAAKSIATASALAGGRMVCGVSAGWLQEEYAIAGIDFASRGRRLDEILDVMRKLWTGEVVRHEGEFFKFEGIQAPAPARPIRIWCGGDAPPAMRRAARNDGWLPLPMGVKQAIAAVDQLRAMRVELGKPAHGFEVGLALAEPVTPAAVAELEAHGLDDLVVIAPWLRSPWDAHAWIDDGDDFGRLDIKRKALERHASAVLEKLH
jgi:probable F420-dependent oxidoreductase